MVEGVEIKLSDNGFDMFEKVNVCLNVVLNDGIVLGGIISFKIYVIE